jgi:hypothetical protein
MATRSTIWISNEDNKNNFDGIYCHFDGYLENNGVILQEQYKDIDKIKALIELGYLSSINNRVAPKSTETHTFDKPIKDICVAYHRDRGDDFEMYKNVSFDKLKSYFQEYNYLFKDGQWYVQGYLSDIFITINEYKALEEQ